MDMEFEILKCHGSENDFLLLDEAALTIPLAEADRPPLSRLLCDRGGATAGADGVLFVSPEPGKDGRMRMYNPDGSEAEMCGNGLRLVGRYLAERTGQTEVQVATLRGPLTVRELPDLLPGIRTYEAEIGPVSFDPASLPMVMRGPTFVAEPLPFLPPTPSFTALSVPNPHVVAMVEQIIEADLRTWGQAANAHPLFPQGVNMSLVRVLGPTEIFVLTYERGVGITNSCGTAMSASTLVAARLKRVPINSYVDVWNKGGRVRCKAEFGADGVCRRILLAGNATWLWKARVRVDPRSGHVAFVGEPARYTEDAAAYEALKALASIRFADLP
jgi:diaminopimelate epimerase